ncbi:hypothetical protein FQN54_004833 [Arachnomyces sp. PD_36]|nr:hypothetical protein FQN54_004833 [Arachnomyces sp. PD_36]
MASPDSNTQGRSPPPEALPSIPSITENGNTPQPPPNPPQGPRRTSLGFLRRPKSSEPLAERKSSTGGRISKKMLKEQAKEEELRRQREAAAVPKNAPRLPDFQSPPELKTFGGESARPDSLAIVSNRLGQYERVNQESSPNARLTVSQGANKAEPVDPYARTESMTHRGRYSYASSAVSTINSPRRVRRRKDPTPYNILVIGARNSGKTSFLNFLHTALALPPQKRPTRSPDEFDEPPQSYSANSNFTSRYLETEIEGERVGLTLWDSQGLEKNVADLQLREITSFLESKFDDTFAEEMKVVRAPGVRDTHIHCAFLILDPARLDTNISAAERAANGEPAKPGDPTNILGGLDEDLDLQVLRTMQGKTTVVPVISKSDTITTGHMDYLKRAVWDGLKKANLDPLEVLNLEDQDDGSSTGSADTFDEREEDKAEAELNGTQEATEDAGETEGAEKSESKSSEEKKEPSKRESLGSVPSTSNELPYLPLSILSPDKYSLDGKNGPVGRKFPWGFADPYNPEHCDFVKLKDTVFGEWRAELREASREVWYERWRTSRLKLHSSGVKNGLSTRSSPATGGRVTR